MLVAHAVLLAAATKAGQQLRRAGTVRLTGKPMAGLVPGGARAWTIAVLGAITALGIIGHAVDVAMLFGGEEEWFAAPFVWFAALALVAPLYSAVVTPRRFGACFLLGWIASGAVVYLFTLLEDPLLYAAHYAFAVSAVAFHALTLVGVMLAYTGDTQPSHLVPRA